MSAYEVNGKVALITGAGSGIGHGLAQLLLEAGCSVIMADLKLRPEAEETLSEHQGSPTSAKPTAIFHRTDVADWAQLQSLWDESLQHFERIDIVACVAGIYEPPESNFWFPPGIAPESKDPADAAVGQYKIIAINQVHPIRLAQIATDYWTQNKEIQGNYIAVASIGGYVHSFETPLYMSSKAGLVSFVKSMGGLKRFCGIRYSAVCPGAVLTPIYDAEWNRKVTEDDVHLTSHECAAVVMRVMQGAQYGDGSIVETQKVGTKDDYEITARDIPLEALYPKIEGAPNQRLVDDAMKTAARIMDKGLRAPFEGYNQSVKQSL
ncbi:putative short chain dehydrogenase/reductase family oxidoreductase [Colletotrichum karsti]|uniref:Short chain dehydrogenase/reductase family oxidoreductase n=1 Tax=Colletotrichum karsti TaxID=1095194 RepID=A0A9P6I822_9PEZI|nr:putative short chain dehydrogenase/reductase family oxidoreductase [Colletotrichum karsti]KAF9877969.1 putative short chain dehydrogenase/reductase family oxidoreductase [Colletotrichum karsti]